MKSELVAAVAAQLKNADQIAIENAIAKAEAEEIAAFLEKNLKPAIEVAYPRIFGVNASKAASSPFNAFLESAATLVAAKIISDAIRDVGAQTVGMLHEIDKSIMTTV